MGCCKLLLITFLLSASLFVYINYVKKSSYRLPSTADQYWGPKVLKDGEPLPKDDTRIRPLKVSFDQDVVKDLHERLDRTRFVEPLQGANFEDGFNGDYLKSLVHYWRHTYDWKINVEYLNQYYQFTTEIEGLTIHFVRIRPLGQPKTVKAILLVNGWPSNYHQFYELAELLRKPQDDLAFEVVLVSRPGFGYSSPPSKPGFSVSDSVRIYVKLMERLGHKKFYYHGEDWGAVEAHAIGVLYPQSLEGVHTTMALTDTSLKGLLKLAVGTFLPSLVYSHELEMKTFARPLEMFKILAKEIGYFFIQATKPETIGSLLMDSPAGLAAYYLEKFSVGVEKSFIHLPDGGLTKKFTKDQLLTNVMIFWTTGNGAYAVRYYKEFVNRASIGEDITKIPADPNVPWGFTIGEHEIDLSKMKPVGRYNIVKYDYLMGVGHFAAFENPQKLHEHLRKFVSITLGKQVDGESTKTEL